MRSLVLFSFLLFNGDLLAQCNSNFSLTINGAQVSFSPQNTQPGYEHFWNFGDGHLSNSVAPVHSYDQPGTYIVRHLLRDSLQTCVDSTLMVVILNFIPTCQANFISARDSFIVTLYRFTSTSSYSGSNPVNFEWKVDNVIQSNHSSLLEHNFIPGTHTVCLTITTSGGCTSTLCQSLNVQGSTNCNLPVSFYTSYSGNMPRLINFTAYPQQPGFLYRWSFGDGGTAVQPMVQHLYAHAGSYQVKLEVSDTVTGCSDSTIRNIQVQGAACDTTACSFSYIPNSSSPGEITFHANCNKTGGTQRWEIWKPGDSLHVIINANDPTYTFQDTGYYYVCLSVSFPDTCLVHTCQYIYVLTSHHRSSQLPVYPNPAHAELNFYINAAENSRIYIRIIDRNGQNVMRSDKIVYRGSNLVSLPVNNLSPGLYFIEVIKGDNKQRSTFIKR